MSARRSTVFELLSHFRTEIAELQLRRDRMTHFEYFPTTYGIFRIQELDAEPSRSGAFRALLPVPSHRSQPSGTEETSNFAGRMATAALRQIVT